jgi:hypothetical protein
MELSKAAIPLTLLISMTVFVATFYAFDTVYELILPDIQHVSYQTTDFASQIKTSLVFSLVLGIAPILLLVTWRFSPIVSTSKRWTSILITTSGMALVVVVRQQLIRLGLHNSFEGTAISYPVDQLNFEYYILAGLLIGCVCSGFLLRQKFPAI